MNGIREQVDAIVYPTVVGTSNPSNPAWLWEPTVELAKRGILEWGFLDPGSVNFCFIESDGAGLMGGNGVYINTNRALEMAAGLAAEHKFHRRTPATSQASFARARCCSAIIPPCGCPSIGSCSRPE
jgi:3-keto-5-aminohexanoate cleavage enzyme